LKAKIIRSSKRIFDCQVDGSKKIIAAIVPAEIIKKGHPCVGDNVEIEPAKSGEGHDIVKRYPRENEIFRRIVRSNKTKVIAANIDIIFIITSVSKPDYKPFLIDRYLARANQWDIPAMVIFNKMDQFDDQFDMEFEKQKFESIGVDTLEISSTEIDGIYSSAYVYLREMLEGKTAICLGQSGVGKSKLITALSDGKADLLSSRLAKGIQKGAHTTTWAEIVDCENFLIVDSPGVRSLSIQDLRKEELPRLFPDLIPHFRACKFRDCRHEENSKGCSFLDLDEDSIQDRIVFTRLISYLRIRDEVEEIPDWEK